MFLPRLAATGICCFLILLPLGVVSADEPYVDERRLLLDKDGTGLGNFNYGHFLTCLVTASFEDEAGPRDIDRKIKRLIVTTIHGDQWFFKVREEIGYVIIEDITINTQHYTSLQDKSRHILHILAHCQLPTEVGRS